MIRIFHQFLIRVALLTQVLHNILLTEEVEWFPESHCWWTTYVTIIYWHPMALSIILGGNIFQVFVSVIDIFTISGSLMKSLWRTFISEHLRGRNKRFGKTHCKNKFMREFFLPKFWYDNFPTIIIWIAYLQKEGHKMFAINCSCMTIY